MMVAPYRCVVGAVLLLLPACGCLEPSGYAVAISPTIAEGIQMALRCGQQHGLRVVNPPASLRFYLSPSLGDLGGSMRADDVRGNRIFVDERVKDEARVWFHSALHALYGLPGGPSSAHPRIFSDCGILEP